MGLLTCVYSVLYIYNKPRQHNITLSWLYCMDENNLHTGYTYTHHSNGPLDHNKYRLQIERAKFKNHNRPVLIHASY